MTIYYVVYASIFLVAMVTKAIIEQENKRNSIITVWCGLCLFLILALRHWSIGIDLGYYAEYDIGYIQSFEKLCRYPWSKILSMDSYLNYEKGYIIFNKLIGCITQDKQVFLGICAFINILPIAVLIYKRSELPFLSWIIFMALPTFFMFFSGIRQSIAISITVLAVHYIEEQKKFQFVLTVLLASAFHYSAMLFLIAYPIYYIETSQLQKMIFAMVIPVVYIFKAPLFTLLSKILKDNAVVEDTGAGLLFLLFVCIYMFLIFFNKDADKKQNGFINLFYVACICQAFSGVYSTAMRVGYYFMIYASIAVPNTVVKFKNKGRWGKNEVYILFYFILIAFVLFGLYQFQLDSFSKTNPYYFFWENRIT